MRALGGLPQHSPSAPQSAPWKFRHGQGATSFANIRDREKNGEVDLIDLAEIRSTRWEQEAYCSHRVDPILAK